MQKQIQFLPHHIDLQNQQFQMDMLNQSSQANDGSVLVDKNLITILREKVRIKLNVIKQKIRADISALCEAILSEGEFEQIKEKIQEELTKKEIKIMNDFIQSSQFKDFRKQCQIQKLQKKDLSKSSENEKLKFARLRLIQKINQLKPKFKQDVSIFFSSILQFKEYHKQFEQLGNKLSKKQLKIIEDFLKSQMFLQFKKVNLSLNQDEHIKVAREKLVQLINKISPKFKTNFHGKFFEAVLSKSDYMTVKIEIEEQLTKKQIKLIQEFLDSTEFKQYYKDPQNQNFLNQKLKFAELKLTEKFNQIKPTIDYDLTQLFQCILQDRDYGKLKQQIEQDLKKKQIKILNDFFDSQELKEYKKCRQEKQGPMNNPNQIKINISCKQQQIKNLQSIKIHQKFTIEQLKNRLKKSHELIRSVQFKLINPYTKVQFQDNQKIMNRMEIELQVIRKCVLYYKKGSQQIQFNLSDGWENVVQRAYFYNKNFKYGGKIIKINGEKLQNTQKVNNNTFKKYKNKKIEINTYQIFSVSYQTYIYQIQVGRLLNSIRQSESIKRTHKFFNQKNQILLDQQLQITENLKCLQCEKIKIKYFSNISYLLIPLKFSISQLLSYIIQSLKIGVKIDIILVANQRQITLQSNRTFEDYFTKHKNISFLHIIYSIKLDITKNYEINTFQLTVKSNQSIKKIKQRVFKKIGIKLQAQKLYLNDQELIDDQTNFQHLEIYTQNCRISLIQKKNLQYYGFENIISINKNRFKEFFIEDDEQFIRIINKSPFPESQFRQQFRTLVLGYIFSAIKKHSSIQNALQHIIRLVDQSQKTKSIWKAPNLNEKCMFNQIYVLYNILNSSETNLRIDIMKMINHHTPVPLICKLQASNSKYNPFYQQNFWISNKGFWITSCGLSFSKQAKVNGKSILLNAIFQTQFKDKKQIHDSCRGGIQIQYNIYRNQEYNMNLIDISDDFEDQAQKIQIIKNSNLLLIHSRQEAVKTKKWIEDLNIKIPIVILYRDKNQIINLNQRSKSVNQDMIQIEIISYKQQNSFNYYKSKTTKIIENIQKFILKNYSKIKQNYPEQFWKFNQFLARKSSQKEKNCLEILEIFKQLQKESNLMQVSNHFIQYKILESKIFKLQQDQLKNKDEMQKLKQQSLKKKLAGPFEKFLKYIQRNKNMYKNIMCKFRIFLLLKRNQEFEGFNQLLLFKQRLQKQFQKNKELIKIPLNRILQKNQNILTEKAKRLIHQYLQKSKNPNSNSKQFEREMQDRLSEIIKEYELEIQPRAFSIENFWREINYLMSFDKNIEIQIDGKSEKIYNIASQLAKNQVKQCQNFQVIDGDLLEMHKSFLTKIFQNNKQKKVMVVGVFGPQSSGKSTLLNFILGCDFMSSAGRCTKGIYGTYFQISNRNIPNCEAILILDTEGLFSNYENKNFQNRQNFDSKLVLFCLSICDIMILNTRGDIDKHCQDIVEVTFDSQLLEDNNNKKYPSFFFCLNQNGGDMNSKQISQVQKMVDVITKSIENMKYFISSNQAKGMPNAFNDTQHKFIWKQIDEYMNNKKVPTQNFYKATKQFCSDIMDKIYDRGTKYQGNTFEQIIQKMQNVWSTINKFPILTKHINKITKKLQEQITKWKLDQKQKFNEQLMNRKKKIPYQLKEIANWERENLIQLNKIISQIIEQYKVKFPKTQDPSMNKLITLFMADIDPILTNSISNFRLQIQTRTYDTKIKQSQLKGLDDMNYLAIKIKQMQLKQKRQFDQQEKGNQFQKLWKQLIQDMKNKIDKKIISQQNFKYVKDIYQSYFTKTNSSGIRIINLQRLILPYSEKNFLEYFYESLKNIKSNYNQIYVFQPTQRPPVMNINKQSISNLSYEYLDMGNYFSTIQKRFYIYVNIDKLQNCLDTNKISSQINTQFSKNQHIDDFVKKLITQVDYYSLVIYQNSIKSSLLTRLKNNSIWNSVRDWCGYNYFSMREKNQNYQNFHNKQKTNYTQIITKNLERQFEILDKQQIKKLFEIQEKKFKGSSSIISVMRTMINQKMADFCKDFEQKHKSKCLQEILNQITANLNFINIKCLNQQLTKKKLQLDILDQNYKKFKNYNEFKDIMINRFSKYWNIRQLQSISYTNNNQYNYSKSHKNIGYFASQTIDVKNQFKAQSILKKYINKQYNQFLVHVKQISFKKFIKQEFNYEIIFKKIYEEILRISKTQDLKKNIIKIYTFIQNQIIKVNNDLSQVAQKLTYEFIHELHEFAVKLLWKKILEIEWKQKQSIIITLEERKEKQKQKFFNLVSGDQFKINAQMAQNLSQKYIELITTLITNQKQKLKQQKSYQFSKVYTRKNIQLIIEDQLQNQTDPQIIKQYLLSPQKVIEDKYKYFYQKNLSEVQSLYNFDPKILIYDMNSMIKQFKNELKQQDQKYNAQSLFEDGLYKQQFIKDIFIKILTSQDHMVYQNTDFKSKINIKPGVIIRIKNGFKQEENKKFIIQLDKDQKLIISNLKLFLYYFNQKLQQILNRSESLFESNLNSESDANDYLKRIKMSFCINKCPCCDRLCDIDMKLDPAHSVHKIQEGHNIRAVKGMRIEYEQNGNKRYKASILRCQDLNPDSIFEFNGKQYTWKQFCEQNKSLWNFEFDKIKAQSQRPFFKRLWSLAGNQICDYHSKIFKQQMQYAEYDEHNKNVQLNSIAIVNPTMYIFALDESGSMSGNPWQSLIHSLKGCLIQLAKSRQYKLSIIAFENNARIVCENQDPSKYDVNRIGFRSGGTTFAPAYEAALTLMNKYNNMDINFTLISDGEAQYPTSQIQRIKQFSKNLSKKSLHFNYSSILIGSGGSIMERIRIELGGKNHVISNTSSLKTLMKQTLKMK